MEFKIFLGLLRKRRWSVLIIFAITIVSTLVLTRLQTPIYSSSATYVVSPSSEVLNETGFLSGLSVLGGQPTVVNTYANIATSASIKREASDSLGLSPAQARKLSVSSRVLSGTNIIEITVEGEDPLLVQVLTTRVGESTIDFIKTLNGVYDLKLMDGAESPDKPIRPNIRLNLVLGAALGLILGVGIAFLLGLSEY